MSYPGSSGLPLPSAEEPCDAHRRGRAAELAARPVDASLRQPRRVSRRSALRAPTPTAALLGCAKSPRQLTPQGQLTARKYSSYAVQLGAGTSTPAAAREATNAGAPTIDLVGREELMGKLKEPRLSVKAETILLVSIDTE